MAIAGTKPKREVRRSTRRRRKKRPENQLESHQHHDEHHHQPKSMKNSFITPKKQQEKDCSCDCEHHDHESPRTVYNIKEMLKVTRPSPSELLKQCEENPERIAFVDKMDGLKKIQEESVQLAVWRQAEIPNFIHTLSDTAIKTPDLPEFEGLVLPGNNIAEYLKRRLWVPYNLRSHKKVLDEQGMDQLVQHIEDLVNIFASICREEGFLTDEDGEYPLVSIKLKAVEGNGCVYWHQDCVPFRMVATYRGPCTEYVPPAHSVLTLEQRQIDSEHAQSLSHCDVALFKGKGDLDDAEEMRYDLPGIVHRSPRTEGSGISRLVLVIDIPQEGWHY